MNRLLIWLFATMLRGYPRAFRRDAESEMLRAFHDGLQKQSPALRRTGWAVRQLADAGRNLLMVWRERIGSHANGRRGRGGVSSSGGRPRDGLTRAPWRA